MRVVPKHHLHETLETATGCTQPTFCSTDASSWWRRPSPTGWATRSCWWPALGPGCTGGHWSWVHSTSHCWAIIRSPPVGYTGCLLTLAGGQVGPSLLLPTHSLSSSRVVPASATSTPTPDRWWKEPWLTAEREAKSLWSRLWGERLLERGRSHLEKAEARWRAAAEVLQWEASRGLGGRSGEGDQWARGAESAAAGSIASLPLISSYTSFFLLSPGWSIWFVHPFPPLHFTYSASYIWSCHSERPPLSSNLKVR